MHPGRIVLVIAMVTTACSGTRSTDPASDTIVTATTPEAATPISEPTPQIDWVRIDNPEVFGGGLINAVTVGGPGLVAVGTDELPENAAA